MKGKSFVYVEVGVDGVQKFDLDDGGEGEARCGVSGQAMASCSMRWLAVACYRVAMAS